MESLHAPLWSLLAQAIDGAGDTHLPDGLHVRVLPSARLGIPATPLVVTRALLDARVLKTKMRQDGVVWRDKNGAVRVPPFAVTPDNPVIGYFPQTDVVYAALSAESQGALRFEALGSSGQGHMVLQSRSNAPYALAGFTIPMVRLVGTGSVRALSWLDSSVTQGLKEEFWAIWSLPVKPAPRYTPTPNAHAEAKMRVEAAQAKRKPLYIAFSALSAATAPAALPGDAMDRVSQVAGEFDDWLATLLNDLSAPTGELTDTRQIKGKKGQLSVPIEPALIGGSLDPDIGHWLGLGDVDRAVKAAAGQIVFYRIRGLWRWNAKAWRSFERPAFLPGIRQSPEPPAERLPALKAVNVGPKEAGPFVDLHAWADAIVGVPPDRPPPPVLQVPQDRGWLATPPPPDVRRAVGLTAGNFRPHALAALMAADARGPRTLHAFPRSGRLTIGRPLPKGTPLPLVVSRPGDPTDAGQGRFDDRDAPAGAVDYRLAQGDWFGRWSDFASINAPAKPRTRPMRPTIEIFTAPPVFGTPVPNGLLSGSITLRIVVPQIADLPAGGALLSRLDLVQTFGVGAPVTLPYSLPVPAGASLLPDAATEQVLLVIPRTGPALPRCGSAKVSYTARWVDVLGTPSLDADPVARTMVDPRPPVAPTVETRLRYTARPDAQGHARVDLDFSSSTGTRYRVFASNETTLLKALEGSAKPGAAAAAASIRAVAPGAPRAGAFKLAKGFFGWDHFENLTREPIVATGSTTRFVHRVSGSLDVLAIYRVLAEGPSGQLSDMEAADLVPFAVPNLGPPARPQVALVNAGLDPTQDGEGVMLRVKVPLGRAVPKAWRLRRASVPVAEALRMGVVATGPVTDAVTDDQGTSFEIHATDGLPPWRQMRFAVEVQADDPPGAPTVGVVMPGEWSEASAPVPLAIIPPEGPAAPSAVTIAAVAGGLQISVAHPAAAKLIGTGFGPHRFEVWRGAPGGRPVQKDLGFRLVGGAWVATDAGPVASGSFVSVRVIDPIGRRSDAAVSNTV